MSQNVPARPTRAWPDRRRLTLWLAIALGALALIALCIVFVDEPVAQAKPAWLNSIGVEVVETLGYWAGGWPLAPSLLAVALIYAGVRWRRLLLSFVVAYLMRTAAVESLKWLTGRPRPRQMDGVSAFYGPSAEFHSFPSGHAAFGFMFAVLLSAYFPRYRWLWYAGAVLICVARVTCDAHFVSDVILGGVIGALVALLVLRRWPPDAPVGVESSRFAGHAPEPTR